MSLQTNISLQWLIKIQSHADIIKIKNEEKNDKGNWRKKIGYHNVSTVGPKADLITEWQETENGRLKYSKCCKEIAKSGILYTEVYFGMGTK